MNHIIHNFSELAKTKEREVVLTLIEEALRVIQPSHVIPEVLKLVGDSLTIKNQSYTLSDYNRIFLIGFGKGSAAFSLEVENILGDRLAEGYDIDVESAEFKTIQFSEGTHPLPSEQNYTFTKNLFEKINGWKLTQKDLVLVVVCGGGSAMLVLPNKISLETQIATNKTLLESGADIFEMNTVRKHLSNVKGGGLAAALIPATVATLIFSDVPGNDLSFIASGPTVFDKTTKDDAITLLKKYNITTITPNDLSETPKDESIFAQVQNHIVLSNLVPIHAMEKKAKALGWKTKIFTDTFQHEAHTAGKVLLDATPEHTILLAGGETTVHVSHNHGRGGRNQEVVLGALPYVGDEYIIASFDSDGWDNSPLAGAIGDNKTIERAKKINLDPEIYLKEDDSLDFFNQEQDGIKTGRYPSNVSDLFIVLRV